jgi:ribonucleoside-diphosphate reductase beta chain
MRFETDGILAAKNEHIMKQSSLLQGDQSHAQFARAIIGNVVLEGVYFYSGFLVFYVLGRGGEMTGSADGIKLINRDEITHLHIFANMHHTHKAEEPWVYDAKFYEDARAIIREAVELEIKWGKYIISKGVPGMSDIMMEEHVKSLANERCVLLGMEPLYPGVKTPYGWVEQFSNPNNKREKNFFESVVVDYSVGTLDDWGD